MRSISDTFSVNKIVMDLTRQDLEKMFRTNGCPVCNYLTDALSGYFAHFQYLLSSDADAMAQHADEFGFCPLHTWQLFAFSSKNGMAVGHRQRVERVADELSRLAEDSKTNLNEIKALVKNSGNCRVCLFLRAEEAEYIKQLCHGLDKDVEALKSYESSQAGICLAHLSQIIDKPSSIDLGRVLLLKAARNFSSIAVDMKNFAMKYETRERHLLTPREKDACRRAIVQLVGNRNINIAFDHGTP
jgi:hypothetical protein